MNNFPLYTETKSQTNCSVAICIFLMEATRCSRNVAEPTSLYLDLYWHPHRLAYTCVAFHLDWQLRLTLNLDISNYSKLKPSHQVPATFMQPQLAIVVWTRLPFLSGTGFLIFQICWYYYIVMSKVLSCCCLSCMYIMTSAAGVRLHG